MIKGKGRILLLLFPSPDVMETRKISKPPKFKQKIFELEKGRIRYESTLYSSKEGNNKGCSNDEDEYSDIHKRSRKIAKKYTFLNC